MVRNKYPDQIAKLGRFFFLAILIFFSIFFLTSSISVSDSSCLYCHKLQKIDQVNPHTNLSCNTCHWEKKAENILKKRIDFTRMLLSYIWKMPNLNSAAEVADGDCISCHKNILNKKAGKTIRMVHEEKTLSLFRCADCHFDEIHEKSNKTRKLVDMTACISCHNQNTVTVSCESCHTKKVALTSSYSEIGKTYHQNWTHFLYSPDSCYPCHTTNFCRKCHATFFPHEANWGIIHGTYTRDFERDCGDCHSKNFCDACHTGDSKVPHSIKFIEDHSSITKKVGESDCKRCHGDQDCKFCHERHIHRPVPSWLIKEFWAGKIRGSSR